MIPGQRRPEHVDESPSTVEAWSIHHAAQPPEPGVPPEPGDLYLDPAIPPDEQVTVSCGDWSAPATHVWTGLGWSRLRVGPVRPVPTSQALQQG